MFPFSEFLGSSEPWPNPSSALPGIRTRVPPAKPQKGSQKMWTASGGGLRRLMSIVLWYEISLEARGGERKLAGLPVVCCWCCCCWCCCCSAGAGSSAAAAAAGAGWSAAAAAAAALGMLLPLLLPPLGGLLLLLLVLLLLPLLPLLPLLRWALQMLGVLQLLGGPAHRAQGGVEPRGGGGVHKIPYDRKTGTMCRGPFLKQKRKYSSAYTAVYISQIANIN